jgi:hypothetical protein
MWSPSTIVVVILFLVSNSGEEARYAMRRNATRASIHTIMIIIIITTTSCMRFFFCFLFLSLEEAFSLSSTDGIGGGSPPHWSSLFLVVVYVYRLTLNKDKHDFIFYSYIRIGI